MSFSQRQSKWANSGLVVNIEPVDYAALAADEGYDPSSPLCGVEWQRVMERRAAAMGGGSLVCPVQRVTDFMAGQDPYGSDSAFAATHPLPTSSYRLGVRAAPLHTLYPSFVTRALQEALLDFDRRIPGLICDDGLLHGIESRTSAPVRIERDATTLQSTNKRNLYPAGEGAGYAGGIVSAAVDGMKIANAIAVR